MKSVQHLLLLFLLLSTTLFHAQTNNASQQSTKKLVYLVSDMKIPFWQIMAKGIKNKGKSFGYDVEIYDVQNSAKKELELTIKAIKNRVDGIIVSPTNSSACVTILKLAKSANIPVVISDIGTDSGDYVSYISSNNYHGAYKIGKILTNKMMEKSWNKGSVGIIAIPQTRLNGQQRTAGFMKALKEHNIKGADIKQLNLWTQEESYQFTKDMIQKYPNLRAIWLQSSNTYIGVLKAIEEMGKKKDIIFISFDAEPEFIDLIKKGEILAAAMQQPYLMGQESVTALHNHLLGQKVAKHNQLSILDISTKNIEKKLNVIKLNVLGIETK